MVSLWLHDLSSGATRELPGTNGAAMPFWSPDMRSLGFFADLTQVDRIGFVA